MELKVIRVLNDVDGHIIHDTAGCPMCTCCNVVPIIGMKVGIPSHFRVHKSGAKMSAAMPVPKRGAGGERSLACVWVHTLV